MGVVMPTVTYKAQPAIHATRGAVAEGGNEIPYTVSKILWPKQVERWVGDRLVGRSLHVCCGKSMLGTVRLDLYEPSANVRADAARLPFADGSFDTVFCDPPYNGKMQWAHDVLSELARVSSRRIIFQHWFAPVDRKGQYKKANRFKLIETAVWQGHAYFGRAQIITVFEIRE